MPISNSLSGWGTLFPFVSILQSLDKKEPPDADMNSILRGYRFTNAPPFDTATCSYKGMHEVVHVVHTLVDRNGPIVVVLAAVRRIAFDSLVSIPLAVLLTILLAVMLAFLLIVLLTVLLTVIFALLFTIPLAVPLAAGLALILLILLAVIGIGQGIGRFIGQFIEPVRVANWPREPGAAPDESRSRAPIMAPINSSDCPTLTWSSAVPWNM